MPFMQDRTRYVYKWVARNLFLMIMRMKETSNKNMSLEQDKSGTIWGACVADSAAWGWRFAENGQGELNCKALFQELQYKQPPDFGSMRDTQLP